MNKSFEKVLEAGGSIGGFYATKYLAEAVRLADVAEATLGLKEGQLADQITQGGVEYGLPILAAAAIIYGIEKATE